MSSIARFGRYLKDFWKIVIRGEDDELQGKIRGVQEQVKRLREFRAAQAKEREAAALKEARVALEKVQQLHKSLVAAEEATAEFASKLADQAKKQFEAEMQIGEKVPMKLLLKQKELFQKELEASLADKKVLSPHLLARLAEQGENNLQPEASIVSPHMSAQQGGQAEDELQVEASSVDTHVASPGTLAQLAEEAKKQVELEGKAHLEVLLRHKECLQKEMEASSAAGHMVSTTSQQ